MSPFRPLGSEQTADAQAPNDLLTLPVAPHEVRDADYARLKAILSQVRLGLDNNSRSMVRIQRVAKQLPRQDRSQFDDAYAQVRAREVALRNSILAATTATPENAAAAQAQVAADYEAYARAVTVADASARASRQALATNTTDLR